MTHTEIRSPRLALGMTQAELARYLGLRTVGAVAHLEAEPGTPGHRKPTGPVLRLLEILRDSDGKILQKPRTGVDGSQQGP
jgi:DNA-binding transcriptional regulator YiaG